MEHLHTPAVNIFAGEDYHHSNETPAKRGLSQKSKIIYHKEHKGNSPSTQMIETNLLILSALRVKLCELGGKMDFWDSLFMGAETVSKWPSLQTVRRIASEVLYSNKTDLRKK